MKSVLISIQPKWVEKIASGEKTIVVRKSRPKLETPIKCYIYCTQAKRKEERLILQPFGYALGGLESNFTYGGDGKVIGEFVCDSVYEWNYRQLQGLNGTINTYFPIFAEDLPKTCLTHKDIENYGKGKTLYGWHISNLKIYDKPKELSEFRTPCKMGDYPCCGICDYAVHGMDGDLIDCDTSLTRPPQSWCYVEENEDER